MLDVHSAGDLRVLADRLADVLSAAPADPMQPEFVAVPSAGMRTWLSLQLAHRLGSSSDAAGTDLGDGVSANVEFPFPGSLRLRLLEAEGSIDRDRDPWDVERLPWTILELADTAVGSGDHGRLPSLLLEAPPGGSRWSAARRVADLFDRYHLHRPAMIEAWAGGKDVDGIGNPLDSHHVWQAELWRSLRDRLAVPSPPERMAALLPGLRAGDMQVDLPDRVCVFGMSLLPGGPGFMEMAAALGTHREVHLFVVEPSPRLRPRFLASISDSPTAATTVNASGHRLRKEVDPAALHHPLLRSWGRLHYETASILVDARSGSVRTQSANGAGAAGTAGTAEGPASRVAEVTPLGLLKSGIHEDRPSVGDTHAAEAAFAMPKGFLETVEFHACHGPTRQVEVMRDTILRLLNDHEDLQEDDILVVCPDLEAFAPLIEATLGPSAHTAQDVTEADPVPSLRYRMADRSLAASVPLVSAFTALLELVSGRFDAPSVLDFLTLAPVRRRFGFDDDDLATITQWVLDTNVRWGLDPGSRESLGVPATVTTNTWQAGIDRILTGAAVVDPTGAVDSDLMVVDTVGSVIPRSIEGSDVGLAGRLSDVMWRLGDLAAATRIDRTPGGWMELLEHAAEGMLAVERDQQWQLDRLLGNLGEVVESSRVQSGPQSGSSRTLLTFVDIRRVLEDRLASMQGRPSFLRGGVTISSVTPLRWVPHKVIVMLGMDSEALGSATTDGDDLGAMEPLVGDRDPRNELRQSMLETVLAAGEHLVVIRNGHDVRTNQPVPMPVAVAELRDAVVGMVSPAFRDDLLKRIEIDHPRQAFDELYFVDDAEGPRAADGSAARPARSFDRRSLAGAVSKRERCEAVHAFLESPLDEEELAEVTLTDLHRFLRNPIRHFIERRLDMRLPRDEDAPSGILTMSLAGLDAHALGAQLLDLLSAEADAASAKLTWQDVAIRTGAVPVGSTGEQHLKRIELEVDDLIRTALAAGVRLGQGGSVIPVDLAVGGPRIVGSVHNDLHDREGDSGGPAYLRFVRRRPAHELSMWLDLAVLTLMHPESRWRGVLATRDGSARKHKVGETKDVGRVDVSTIQLSPDDPVAAAGTALGVVVDLYRRGACEPLPLFRKLSAQVFGDPGSDLTWPDRNVDDAEMLVYGRRSASEVARMPILERDPPGGGQDRLSRYAEYLFGALTETTVTVGGEES